jgi:protein-S-isoprenylcysteine O-methyltransferase Ste14
VNVQGTPSAWRIAGAILALPFIAVVVVPAIIIVVGAAERWGFEGAASRTASVAEGLVRALVLATGIGLIGIGIGLVAWTVRLFASRGRGTLAPWDPPQRLVVAGPYRYLRHPMITGVALTLAGETLLFGLTELAIWLGAFLAVNAIYLPLVEEPALVRRFGPEYERYMANVRRWVPRLRPWDPGK